MQPNIIQLPKTGDFIRADEIKSVTVRQGNPDTNAGWGVGVSYGSGFYAVIQADSQTEAEEIRDNVAAMWRGETPPVSDIPSLGKNGAPAWIVNDLGELGVLVDGRAYFLYKGESLEYIDCSHDDGTPKMFRHVGKREFGETCEPAKIMRIRCQPTLSSEDLAYLRSRYTEGDGWRPLTELRRK